MKKTLLTLAMIAVLAKASAQEVDSTKNVNDKTINPIEQTDTTKTKTDAVPMDNFTGNIEIIVGSNESAYNTYVRPNLFYNLPGGISGYNWTEVYTDGTICGRNTLSKTIVGKLGAENQFLYNTKGLWGMTDVAKTGVGLDYTFTPTKNILIKPYFTPVLFNSKGIVENTSITGVYFTAKPFPNTKILKNITVSGFGEMNFSAKVDENDNGTTKDDKLNPEWSYGELCVNYTFTPHSAVEYVPSLTNKGAGVPAPKVNHRIAYVYTF